VSNLPVIIIIIIIIIIIYANEIYAMWKQKAAQVIPIVISSTGVIPKSLSQSLTTLNLHPNTRFPQKSVILVTYSIVMKLFKLQNKTTEPNPVDYCIP